MDSNVYLRRPEMGYKFSGGGDETNRERKGKIMVRLIFAGLKISSDWSIFHIRGRSQFIFFDSNHLDFDVYLPASPTNN